MLSFQIRAWVWFYLWFFLRPPTIHQLGAQDLDRLRDLEARLVETRKHLEQIKPQVRFHADNLDYLAFALDQSLHLTHRLLGLDAAARLKAQGRTDVAAAQLKPLVEEIQDLRSNFSALWLRTNKPEGLEPNLKRFDALGKAYLQLIKEVSGGGPT
jgi:hypothetical protein